jgi:hypothetical protein
VKSTNLDPFSEFWALVLNLVRRIFKLAILDPSPHQKKKKKKKKKNKLIN